MLDAARAQHREPQPNMLAVRQMWHIERCLHEYAAVLPGHQDDRCVDLSVDGSSVAQTCHVNLQ